MAFTGTPTINIVGKNINRIDGVTLAATVSGTIGNAGSGTDIELGSNARTINSNTIVQVQQKATGGATTPFAIVESSGIITITNTDGANASTELNMFIKQPHSIES